MNKVTLSLCALLIAAPTAFADNAPAPVVDLSALATTTNSDNAQQTVSQPQAATTAAPAQPTSAQPQMTTQQMSANSQVVLLTKIQQLQQDVRDLRGQLEVQDHEIQMLKQQQLSFYNDLQQQISGNSNKPQQTKVDSIDTSMTKVTAPAKPDKLAYQKAYTNIIQRNFNQAEVAFKQFISTYPDSAYVANAHYWLGEVYLQQKNSQQALTEFNTVVNNYASSAKYPDAMLKLAYVYQQQGDTQKAQQQLTLVAKDFPNTSVAQLAENKLQQGF